MAKFNQYSTLDRNYSIKHDVVRRDSNPVRRNAEPSSNYERDCYAPNYDAKCQTGLESASIKVGPKDKRY